MKYLIPLIYALCVIGCAYKPVHLYDQRTGLIIGASTFDVNNGSLSPHASAEDVGNGNAANLDNFANGNTMDGQGEMK